jgi:hypothetical protein
MGEVSSGNAGADLLALTAYRPSRTMRAMYRLADLESATCRQQQPSTRVCLA